MTRASCPTSSRRSMRGDTEGALQLIVGAVPAAGPDERERLREVAVALFERLDPDDPLVGTYRRRLAAALY